MIVLSELEKKALTEFGTKAHDLAFENLSPREKEIFICAMYHVIKAIKPAPEGFTR